MCAPYQSGLYDGIMAPPYQFANNKYQSKGHQKPHPYVLYAPVKASEEETAQRIATDAIVADVIYAKALKGGQGLAESRWAPKNFDAVPVSHKSVVSIDASAPEWSPENCSEKQVSPKSGSCFEDSRWAPKKLGDNFGPSSQPMAKVNFKSPPVDGVKTLAPSFQYLPSPSVPSSWGQSSMSSDTWAMYQAVNSKSTRGSNGAQSAQVASIPLKSAMSNKPAKAGEIQAAMGGPVQSLRAIPPHTQGVLIPVSKQGSRTRTPEQIVRYHLCIPKEPEQPKLPKSQNANTNSSSVATGMTGTAATQQLEEQPMAVAASREANNVSRPTRPPTRPPGWIPPHLSHLSLEQVERIQSQAAVGMAYRVPSQASTLVAGSATKTPEQISSAGSLSLPEPATMAPHLAQPCSVEQSVAQASASIVESTIKSHEHIPYPTPPTITESTTKISKQVAPQSPATITNHAINATKPTRPPTRPPGWIPPHLSHLPPEQVESIRSQAATSMVYQVPSKASTHVAKSENKAPEQIPAPTAIAEPVKQFLSQASTSATESAVKETKPKPSGPPVRPSGWIPPHLSHMSFEQAEEIRSQAFCRQAATQIPYKALTNVAASEIKETQEAPAHREFPGHHQGPAQAMYECTVGNEQPQVQSVPTFQSSVPSIGQALQPFHTENKEISKPSEKDAYEADRVANDRNRMVHKYAAITAGPKTNNSGRQNWPHKGSAQTRPLGQQKSAVQMTQHNGVKQYNREGLIQQHNEIVQNIENFRVKLHGGTHKPKVSAWEDAVAKKLPIQGSGEPNFNSSYNSQPISVESQNIQQPINATAQQQIDHVADPLTKEALQQAYGTAPTECGTRSVVSNTGVGNEKPLQHQTDPRGHLYKVHGDIEVRWDGTWGPDFRDWHDRPDFEDSNLNEYIRQWTNSLRDMPPVCLKIKDPAFISGKYGWYNRFIDHPDVEDYPQCKPNPVTDNAIRQFGDTTESKVAEYMARRAKRIKILRMSRNVATSTLPLVDVVTTAAAAAYETAETLRDDPLYIRPAGKKDLVQITKIYNYHVLNSNIPEDQVEVRVDRIENIYLDCQHKELPFLVAIGSYPPTRKEMRKDELVVGFAFIEDWSVGIAGSSNGRSRHTGKVNLYVHSKETCKGIGYNLLDRLLEVITKGYTSEARCPFVAPVKAPYAPGGGGKKAYHQIMMEMPYRISEKAKQECIEDWLRNNFRFNRVANLEGIARSKGRYGQDAEFLNVAILQRHGDHHQTFAQYP